MLILRERSLIAGYTSLKINPFLLDPKSVPVSIVSGVMLPMEVKGKLVFLIPYNNSI